MRLNLTQPQTKQTAVLEPPARKPPMVDTSGWLGPAIGVILLAGVALWFKQSKANPNGGKAQQEYLQRLAANPLEGCWICTACGWFGRPPAAEGAAKPSMLGGGGSSIRLAFGIGLIILGLLLLEVCIGVIPLVIGLFLCFTYFTAANKASHKKVIEAIHGTTPKACPSCSNHNVIPASSPNGTYLINSNPVVNQAATLEINNVQQLAASYNKDLKVLPPPKA